ncbi:MAG: hypothetical protein V8Q76_05285 [Bacteroides intestinalis]
MRDYTLLDDRKEFLIQTYEIENNDTDAKLMFDGFKCLANNRKEIPQEERTDFLKEWIGLLHTPLSPLQDPIPAQIADFLEALLVSPRRPLKRGI